MTKKHLIAETRSSLRKLNPVGLRSLFSRTPINTVMTDSCRNYLYEPFEACIPPRQKDLI